MQQGFSEEGQTDREERKTDREKEENGWQEDRLCEKDPSEGGYEGEEESLEGGQGVNLDGIAATDNRSKKKKEKKSVSLGTLAVTVAVCVVFSAFLGALGAIFAQRYLLDYPQEQTGENTNSGQPTEDKKEPQNVTVNKNDAPTDLKENITDVEKGEMSLIEVVEKVSASVVEIGTLTTSSTGQATSAGAGSGVIIAQGDQFAYIVTNYHVIDGYDIISVRLTDKTTYAAELIDGDSDEDIALLKIEPDKELCVADIGSSSSLRVGQKVVAIGNPLGQLGGTVTDGIVSALDRQIKVGDVTMTLLQTNTAINPGNSGGGLFNMAGELVAVVNAKHQQTGIEGLGFAIPIDHIYPMLIEIIEEGYIRGRVAVGFDAKYLDRMNAWYYFGAQRSGIYVIAADASTGLAVGDYITHINSQEVSSDEQLKNIVNAIEIGDKLEITCQRGNEQLNITITAYEYVPKKA